MASRSACSRSSSDLLAFCFASQQSGRHHDFHGHVEPLAVDRWLMNLLNFPAPLLPTVAVMMLFVTVELTISHLR